MQGRFVPARNRTVDARRWLLHVPVIASIAVFLALTRKFLSSSIYFVDDPFISLRYAANLIRTGELAFNPGERLEGYSNLLQVRSPRDHAAPARWNR